MSSDLFLQRTALLLVTAILLSVSGCGKKGPVRPLEYPEPPAPVAAETAQLGESAALFWKMGPAVEGSAETTGFRIERTSRDPERECLDCDDQWQMLARIDLDYSRALFRQDDRLAWFDTSLEIGNVYRYRIFAFDRTGSESAPVSATLNTAVPPAPPTGLSARRAGGAVQLQWKPAADQSDGESRFIGYHVYRRSGNAPFSPFPLTSEPLAVQQFEDKAVDSNRTYGYAIRTVIEKDKRMIQSPRSLETRVPELVK